jgi:hypothetical protein
MPSRGRRSRQARSRETKHSEHRNTSAVRSGDDGADITAEAAQKRKCTRRFSRTGGVHRLDVKLLGQRLMARDFERQVAEFQVRVAVLNGYTALGIPVTKVAG